MADAVVTVFVEGDTEVDFYRKLVAYLREKHGGHLSCKVDIKNVKGVGNYQSKVGRIFLHGVKPKYPDCVYKVILSYDADVFRFSRRPPVDWNAVVTDLKNKGAHEICMVKAMTSIEDWFLYDADGLRQFLHLSKKIKMTDYKGLKGLEQLFLRAGKTYIKGARCKGLVDALDMDVIYSRIKDDIENLEKLIVAQKSDSA